MPTIKSSTELRNNYNAISTFCHASHEPIFITRNGQGDLAVMSIETYETITKHLGLGLEDSREELYRLLGVGRADVKAGRTRPHSEVMSDLKKRLADGTI
jgi:PHD/YefM family antitoxin component YafN of YafNO toxin-antitoxin module